MRSFRKSAIGGRAVVQRARQQCGHATEALIEHFEPIVERYVRRRMRRSLRRFVPAEDVLQMTLARGPQAIDRLSVTSGTVDLQALLFTHAQWVIRNAARYYRRSVRSGCMATYGRRPPNEAGACSELEGAETREEYERLIQRVDALDPTSAAIVRRRSEGRTYPEIAARTGLTAEAVRKRYHRTLRKLRQALGASCAS